MYVKAVQGLSFLEGSKALWIMKPKFAAKLKAKIEFLYPFIHTMKNKTTKKYGFNLTVLFSWKHTKNIFERIDTSEKSIYF